MRCPDRRPWGPPPWRAIAASAIGLGFAWLWLVHAWLSDDALITLRQVINFGHGHGIVWNLGERVQAFTHPLWFGVLALGYAVTGAIYPTTFALSFAAAAAALGILLWRGGGRFLAMVPVIGLLFAQSVIDYTSSGLATPLSYALLAAAGALFLARREGPWFFLLLALAFLTRMDHALLMLPMALLAWRARGFRMADVAPAFALVLAWFAFATVYFGFPLPNTFLAKLGDPVPLAQRWAWFLAYTRVTFEQDPMTLVLCTLGIGAGVLRRDRTAAIALGVLLYGAYLAYIGGDFMRGRLFAAPAVFAVLVLVEALREAPSGRPSLRPAAPVLLAGAASAALGAKPMLNTWNDSNDAVTAGIADERGFYYATMGLLSPHRALPVPKVPERRQVTGYGRFCTGIGAVGMRRPAMRKTDTCALTDPYLARLPAYRTARPGHARRHVPTDFRGWRLDRIDHLPAHGLDRYLSDVRRVVTGPFWSAGRWAALGRLLWHEYDADLARFRTAAGPARYSKAYIRKMGRRLVRNATRTIPFADLPRVDAGAFWRKGYALESAGLRLRLSEAREITALRLRLDNNDEYLLVLARAGRPVASTVAMPADRSGLRRYVWRPPNAPTVATRLFVKPLAGDGRYRMARPRVDVANP